MLTIVGVSWVSHLFARETLLTWHCSFVGNWCKKAWMAAPLDIFWTIWCERNRIVFDNGAISIHWMKSSCLCNLYSWTNLYIIDRPRSLVDFFNWLDCKNEGWLV